jgi:hypothetical protein
MNSAQSDMLLPNTCKQRTYETFTNTEVAKVDMLRNQMGDCGVETTYRQADPGWHLSAPVGGAAGGEVEDQV